jgi:Family of unknown function (DUF6263)
MQQIKFPVLAAGLLFSLTALAQTSKIDVQIGQKFKVETSTKLNSSADVMGQTMENNTDTKTTAIYEILGAGQDGIKLKNTITTMKVEASAMGQNMSFDSDKKDNEGPLADALSKLVNKPTEIILDTKGTIVKKDAAEESGAMGMMGGGNGNETATELIIPVLIGKEIKVGDSFSDKGAVKKEKYESRDSGTYTITAINNEVASISYTGTQFISAVMEQMGMEMTTSSSNTVKSELQMNIGTGLVIAKATVIESSVSIDAAGMTIPATGKTITTIKISPAQ